ncbi:dehydrogenase [Actinomycetota bacterium]|nr:dehydrogenase [Actinomycetota bacterium]
MADELEITGAVDIEGKDLDEIGVDQSENQFNFGAGQEHDVFPWKAEKPWEYEEDGYIVRRSSVWSAPGCHEGCGVLVYSDKETGKFVKLEGDPEDPYNQGRLCPRCLAFKQVIYHPKRILYPLKRIGPRGSDEWERLSWDDALDIVAKEFKRIAVEYGPETIHCLRGTARDNMWQVGRIANTFGSPNEYGFLSGTACYLPRVSLMIMTYGGFMIADMSQFSPLRYDDPDFVVPECTINWGCNPTISNPDFYMGHWITDVQKRGCKLINVEPRVTWLAARADIHLALRPGTDTAIAMGMLKVIFDENLQDQEFCEMWTYGWAELAERCQALDLDEIAKMTWVPKEKIIAAARMFATAKPASIVWGLAVDMQSQGTPCAQAIAALWTVTGNLDVPGGVVFTAAPMGINQPSAGAWGYYDLLTEEMQKTRVGWKEFPMYRYGLTQAQPDMCLELAEQGKVKALWIQTSNGISCMSCERERWYNALQNIEFCAAVDIFFTPMIEAYADIILPVATWAEKKGVRAHYYFLSAITASTATEGEALSDAEINRRLGRRFDSDAEYLEQVKHARVNTPGWPWETEEALYDEMLEPSGFKWQELRENGPVYQRYKYRKYETGDLRPDGQLGFNTPTGRVELYASLFGKMGYDPLPYIEEPGVGPKTTPKLYEEYPLIMITGARTTSFFHSEHRQIPYLRQLTPDPWVQINPQTALENGISEGDWVWIENKVRKVARTIVEETNNPVQIDLGDGEWEVRRVKQRARITHEVQPGTIAAQHAWWFPEQDPKEPNLFGLRQSTIGHLLKNKPGQTGFGADLKCTLAKVYPCTAEEVAEIPQARWQRFERREPDYVA